MKKQAPYNKNPLTARLAKAEKRRTALEPIVSTLLKAGKVAEELLDSEDAEIRLRAVHAVNQCVNTFVRVYEVGELEYRIDEIAEAVEKHNAKPTLSSQYL
jgi:hypothetical protein